MAGKVNALSFDKSCLELFDKLVVPEETDRIESAIALATQAAKDQKEHNETIKAEQKKKVIKPEEEICSLVSYSCKRLIRGMASGRGSARQGFSLALCEILKCIDKLDTKLVLDLIDKSLIIEGPGKPKGGDIRETLLGRVFAYGALLKAGRLNTIKLKSHVVSNLLGISARKDYLSEISYSVVVDILESVSAKDFGILCNMSPKLKEVFGAEVTSCQIEMFQLVLWVWKKFGKQKDVPENGFAVCGKKYNIQEIFEEKFLLDLRSSLLGATCTHPRIHSVWYDLIELIVPSFSQTSEEEDTGKRKAKGKSQVSSSYLQLFWSIIVEDGLLQSSLERKYLALELLKALCPLLSASDLQIVLSEPMLTCLKQNLKKEENYLHTSARKCVRYLHSLTKRDSMDLEAKAVLSISLKQFSSWVKGANVTAESQDGDSNNEAQFHILKNMFYSSVSGVREGENYDAHLLKRQQEMLNQISNICKNSNIEEGVAKEILSFLFKHAFFRFTSNAKKVMDLPKEDTRAITAGIKALPLSLSTYFFDCLVNVLASLFQRPKFSPAYISIRSHLLGLQSELLGLKHVTYSREYTERITETLDALQNAKERIQAKLEREESNSKLITLSMLVDHLIVVQLGEFETDFSSHAKDVVAILDRAFVVSTPPKKRKLNEKFASTSLQDDDLQWNDVLLDLMLSLLSLPNQLVRKTVVAVFSSFISDIRESGLQSLVEVLQQSIDDEMDEEEEDSEEDSEEEEEEEGEEESDDEESSEGESQDEDEKMEFTNDKSQPSEKELAKNMDVDGEEEDESSDSDLDDEAMFKLDSMIAVQFQHRRQMNRKRRAEELLHFKFRVLGLIEDYFKLGSTNPQILLLTEMLLSAIISSSGQGEQIEAKVFANLSKTIKKNLSKCQIERERLAEIDVEAAFGTLEKAVNYIAHINPKKKDVAPTVEIIAHYLLKVLAEIKKETSSLSKDSDMVKLYENALDRFFLHQKKCVLKRDFFIKTFQIVPEFSVHFSGKLAGLVTSSRNDYLKVEASELLKYTFLLADKGDADLQGKLKKAVKKDAKSFNDYLLKLIDGFPGKGKHLLTALKCLSKVAYIGDKLKVSIWDKKHLKKFLEALQDFKSKDSRNLEFLKSLESTLSS